VLVDRSRERREGVRDPPSLARAIEFGEIENARTFGVLDEDEREQLHALLQRVAEASASN
jgi:hypothetical protein